MLQPTLQEAQRMRTWAMKKKRKRVSKQRLCPLKRTGEKKPIEMALTEEEVKTLRKWADEGYKKATLH
jgi:hypothetical protein